MIQMLTRTTVIGLTLLLVSGNSVRAATEDARKIFTTVRQLRASRPFSRQRIESIVGIKFTDAVAGELDAQRNQSRAIVQVSAMFDLNKRISAVDLEVNKSLCISPQEVVKTFGKPNGTNSHPLFHAYDNKHPFAYEYLDAGHPKISFEFEDSTPPILRGVQVY